MRVTLLKAKLHRATVTGADLDYEGSIAIGPELIRTAGLLPYERVDIYNVTTGARFTTYVINGTERGQIMLNGAAARLVQRGDQVIIAAYAEFEAEEARHHRPTVVLLDRENRPIAGEVHAPAQLATGIEGAAPMRSDAEARSLASPRT